MPTWLWGALVTFGENLLYFIAATGLVATVGRKFFDTWLESKFKERLQKLTFEQNKETERLKGAIGQEIEQLKGRINAQVDRKLRLHQFEFETSPRLWELIDGAYTAVAQDIMRFDNHADLRAASDEALIEFANRRKYDQIELNHLLKSTDKNKAVSDIKDTRLANAAQEAIWELRRYNFRNKIFWPPPLSADVEKLLNEMTEVITLNDHIGFRGDQVLIDRHAKLGSIFTNNDRPRLRSIESTIKDRLNLDLIASKMAEQDTMAQ